jgi:hypothetical protein
MPQFQFKPRDAGALIDRPSEKLERETVKPFPLLSINDEPKLP